MQNATFVFIDLCLRNNDSTVKCYYDDYPLIIQGVGILAQEQSFDDRDELRLLVDELPLLQGITDMGRLGFATQLKFRQVQEHRQASRRYLGVRLPNKMDIVQITAWLTEFLLPLDPQAVSGSELVADWCQEQQIEWLNTDHLIRLYISPYVSSKQSHLPTFTRNEVTFSSLKASLGKLCSDSALFIISQLKLEKGWLG